MDRREISDWPLYVTEEGIIRCHVNPSLCGFTFCRIDGETTLSQVLDEMALHIKEIHDTDISMLWGIIIT
jgi:hypothetical protein